MAHRCDGRETCERLLAAAQRVFAAEGFRATTVAMIGRAAGCTAASINYHFGGKEALYQAAWQRSFAESVRHYPYDGGLPPEAPAEARLRALISTRLHFLLDGGKAGIAGQLILRELAEPTPCLAAVHAACLDPIKDYTLRLIDELVGRRLPDAPRHYCLMSLVHQFLAFGFRGGTKPLFIGGGRFTQSEIEALATHIGTFSLAGLQAVAAPFSPAAVPEVAP